MRSTTRDSSEESTSNDMVVSCAPWRLFLGVMLLAFSVTNIGLATSILVVVQRLATSTPVPPYLDAVYTKTLGDANLSPYKNGHRYSEAYSVFDTYLTGKYVSKYTENCGGHFTLMTLLQPGLMEGHTTYPVSKVALFDADVLAGLKLLSDSYRVEKLLGYDLTTTGNVTGDPANSVPMLPAGKCPGVCVPQGKADPALVALHPFTQTEYDAALSTLATLKIGIDSAVSWPGAYKFSDVIRDLLIFHYNNINILHGSPANIIPPSDYFAGYNPVVGEAVAAVEALP